jgi:GDP-L-fucose synthase
MSEGQYRVFVAGHRGLVGSAIVRAFKRKGRGELLTRTRSELDLTSREQVNAFFASEKPTHVYLAAAKVGGIIDNRDHPADFIRENLMIQTNVIDAAWRHGARKLLFLGSSCIYPKLAQQPMDESALLTGQLEPTNDAYAIAKIAGIKMADSYRRQYGFDAISLMPTNVYGPGDLFDLTRSHVLPALIRKFTDAADANSPTVELWGTGTPRREFIHADDLADACVYLMSNYSGEQPVNVGTGVDIAIKDLARIVANATGYTGEISWDPSRPDGAPRKLLNIEKLRALGWSPKIGLEDGISRTVKWYRDQLENDARSIRRE